MDNIYDNARETFNSRPDWQETDQIYLWQGNVRGQAARLFLKRNGGYVGINFALGTDLFVEQFSVGTLTDEGWQLLAWASRSQYDAWVKRAQAWLGQQQRRRRSTISNTPALWVTEAR